jgi:hypothetical protein
MAAFCAWIMIQGFRTGTMEAILKGANLKVDRKARPIGFWVAALWNAFWVGLCFWGAVALVLER